jgi:hypothetical protein
MGYVHFLTEMICLNSFIVLRGSGQTGVFARGGHPNPGFNHGFGGRGYQGHRGGGRSHDYRGRGYGGRSWAHREGMDHNRDLASKTGSMGLMGGRQ